MKVKTIKAYYCDFCGKRMLSGGWMSRHEKGCTMNPGRECRMCEGVDIRSLTKKYSRGIIITEGSTEFGSRFTAEWEKYARKFKIEDIIDDCDGCPACSFAVLRLSGQNHHWITDLIGPFNYKAIRNKYWKERNLDEQQDAERDAMYGESY